MGMLDVRDDLLEEFETLEAESTESEEELLTLDEIFGVDTSSLDEDEGMTPLDDFHAYFSDLDEDLKSEENTYQEDLIIEETVAELLDVGASDPLTLYLRNMGRVPLLSKEEEITLAKTIERGRMARYRLASGSADPADVPLLEQWVSEGQEARRHLIEANTRLVISVAKRYRGYGLPFLDLIQAGNVGLIKAVDKFDYRRGNRFSTYATWWIRQAVTRSLTQHGRSIRIPIHMSDQLRKLDKISQRLEQELGRRPTYEELAEEAGEDPEKLKKMLLQSQTPVSLNKEVGDEESSELEQFIEDDSTPPPDESAELRLLRDQLEHLLTTLEPREAWVLKMRFGLHGSRVYTLKELGKKLGISKERVRQIEGQALRKLRHPYHSRQLRDYR